MRKRAESGRRSARPSGATSPTRNSALMRTAAALPTTRISSRWGAASRSPRRLSRHTSSRLTIRAVTAPAHDPTMRFTTSPTRSRSCASTAFSRCRTTPTAAISRSAQSRRAAARWGRRSAAGSPIPRTAKPPTSSRRARSISASRERGASRPCCQADMPTTRCRNRRRPP